MKELNDEQKRDIAERICSHYQRGLQERQTHEEDWDRWEDQYESEWSEYTGEDGEGKTPGTKSDAFFVPMTLKTINRLESTIVQSFFPETKQKMGKISPSQQRDLTEAMAADMLDAALHVKSDVEPVGATMRALRRASHQSLIHGVAWIKQWWKPVPHDTISHVMQREHVKNRDLVWDPSTSNPENIKYVAQEVWLTEDEIWDKYTQGVYDKVPELTDREHLWAQEQEEDDWRRTERVSDSEITYKYKVIEYWGPAKLGTNEELKEAAQNKDHIEAEDVVATIFRDDVVLRMEENDYADLLRVADPTDLQKLPYFPMYPLPDDTTYGNSLVKWLRELQKEVNSMRNQRRMAIQSNIEGRTFYNVNRMQSLKKLYGARYGGNVPVQGNPQNVVHTEKSQTSTMDLAREEQVAVRDAGEVSGVTHQSYGTSQPGDPDTATGRRLLHQQGQATQQSILRYLSYTFMQPMLESAAWGVTRYVDPPEMKEILNTVTEPPRLEDILTQRYDINLEGGPEWANRQTQLQNIDTALQYIVQLANGMPGVALPVAAKLIARMMPLLGINDAGPLIERAMQQQKQQQQQQEGESGAPAAGAQEAPRNQRGRQQAERQPAREETRGNPRR